MKFHEALKTAVENGAKIRYTGWCAGEYVYVKDGVLYAEDGEEQDELLSEHMLTDNWEIYTPPPKLMRFMEALKVLKNYGRVRRQNWKFTTSAQQTQGATFVTDRGLRYDLRISDLEADDWVEVK